MAEIGRVLFQQTGDHLNGDHQTLGGGGRFNADGGRPAQRAAAHEDAAPPEEKAIGDVPPLGIEGITAEHTLEQDRELGLDIAGFHQGFALLV